MAFEFRYIPEYQLIFERFFGKITLEDIYEVNRQAFAVVNQVDVNVNMLVDLRTIRSYPTSISQMRAMIKPTQNPRLVWVVLVVSNPMIRMIASVLTQLAVRSARFRVFDDVREVVLFIGSLQATSHIPTIPPGELRKILDHSALDAHC